MGFTVEIVFKLVIESNIEMRPTNTVCTPVSQQDITFLPVGTKTVSFGRILWLLAEG